MMRPRTVNSLLLGVCIVSLGCIVWLAWQKPSTHLASADASQVTITTSDGIALAASVYYPSATPAPTVVLLHEYGKDRHQWDPYIHQFLAAGFAVLSYDMRGFGSSRLHVIPASQVEHLNSLPNDVPAVLDFIRQNKSMDAQRVSIVGSEIGADVAFIASGSQLGFKRAVLISPQPFGSALDGAAIAGFAPHDLYGLAASTGLPIVQHDLQQATGQTKQGELPAGVTGITALDTPAILSSIITWLKS